MPGDYHTFTSPRTTWPDEATLQAQLRAQVDPTIGFWINRDTRQIQVKKNTLWTAPQIASAQTVIDNAPAQTTQTLAQAQIDAWIAAGSPDVLALKALVLALIDETNRLRAALRGLGVANLPDVTGTAALNAIRTKAGTL